MTDPLNLVSASLCRRRSPVFLTTRIQICSCFRPKRMNVCHVQLAQLLQMPSWAWVRSGPRLSELGAWSGGTSSAAGTPAPRCSWSRWSLTPCCCWRTREKRENVPFLKWKMINSKYFYRLGPGFFKSFNEFYSRIKNQMTMNVIENLCYSHS